MGPFWDHLGASWLRLGASCNRLGASSGRLGLPKATERQTKKLYFSLVFSILSRCEAFLKPTCLNITSFTLLVPSWAHLGAILGRLGRVLVCLGAVLGPSWRRLGASWGQLGLPKTSQNRSKIDQKSIKKSMPKRVRLGRPSRSIFNGKTPAKIKKKNLL